MLTSGWGRERGKELKVQGLISSKDTKILPEFPAIFCTHELNIRLQTNDSRFGAVIMGEKRSRRLYPPRAMPWPPASRRGAEFLAKKKGGW
jgi:hypothetical protein